MKLSLLKSQLKLPTKLEKVSTAWSDQAGIEFYIKRDDQIHPLISGNKWRKLSGILERVPNVKSVRTYGGPYSNHLVATAVACQLLGLKSSAVIRGENPKQWSTVLSLCKHYSMELHFVSRSEYREIKATSGWVEDCFHIPEGGSSRKGTVGCHSILAELDMELDYLFVACGTGTSLAGLSQKAQMMEKPPFLYGVPVLKGGQFIADEVLRLGGHPNFELILDAHFGGYAKSNKELMMFIEEFAKETNVLLDPIYTSKVAWAIMKKASSGSFERGSKVALIHTGGYTGWYGKWTELLT